MLPSWIAERKACFEPPYETIPRKTAREPSKKVIEKKNISTKPGSILKRAHRFINPSIPQTSRPQPARGSGSSIEVEPQIIAGRKWLSRIGLPETWIQIRNKRPKNERPKKTIQRQNQVLVVLMIWLFQCFWVSPKKIWVLAYFSFYQWFFILGCLFLSPSHLSVEVLLQTCNLCTAQHVIPG